VPFNPDECGSSESSRRPPGRARDPLPRPQIDFPAIQEGASGGGPTTVAADGRALDATTTTSIEDFIAAFKNLLTLLVLSSPPRLRLTRARELDDSELVPKRSARLAPRASTGNRSRRLRRGR